MKKVPTGPLVAVAAIVIVGAMFLYFYLQLNRLDKKVIAVNTTVSQDSGQIGAIVNFFNTNLNGQAK